VEAVRVVAEEASIVVEAEAMIADKEISVTGDQAAITIADRTAVVIVETVTTTVGVVIEKAEEAEVVMKDVKVADILAEVEEAVDAITTPEAIVEDVVEAAVMSDVKAAVVSVEEEDTDATIAMVADFEVARDEVVAEAAEMAMFVMAIGCAPVETTTLPSVASAIPANCHVDPILERRVTEAVVDKCVGRRELRTIVTVPIEQMTFVNKSYLFSSLKFPTFSFVITSIGTV